MDNLFYAGISLFFIGIISLAIFIAYKIGRTKGRKEYYEALTSTHQEDIL